MCDESESSGVKVACVGGLHMHLDGTVLGAQLLQEAIRAFGAAEDEYGECGIREAAELGAPT
jgi:hypothetical protein